MESTQAWATVHTDALAYLDAKRAQWPSRGQYTVASGGAFAVESSGNRKTGITSVTYVSQASCDTACRLHPVHWDGKVVCYANDYNTGVNTKRVNASPTLDSLALASAEASAIDKLSGRHPLRIHVVGDCATGGAASIVSAAASRYTARHGRRAWTYTHAWRDVSRASWGAVSVLASCETVAEACDAKRRGYATAIIYQGGLQRRPFEMTDRDTGESIRVVPCPAQATHGKVSCTTCPNLCRNDTNLKRHNLTVGFSPHGSGAQRLRDLLADLQ